LASLHNSTPSPYSAVHDIRPCLASPLHDLLHPFTVIVAATRSCLPSVPSVLGHWSPARAPRDPLVCFSAKCRVRWRYHCGFSLRDAGIVNRSQRDSTESTRQPKTASTRTAPTRSTTSCCCSRASAQASGSSNLTRDSIVTLGCRWMGMCRLTSADR